MQEALANVREHSGASEVEISVAVKVSPRVRLPSRRGKQFGLDGLERDGVDPRAVALGAFQQIYREAAAYHDADASSDTFAGVYG